jgi:hypothetical protein
MDGGAAGAGVALGFSGGGVEGVAGVARFGRGGGVPEGEEMGWAENPRSGSAKKAPARRNCLPRGRLNRTVMASFMGEDLIANPHQRERADASSGTPKGSVFGGTNSNAQIIVNERGR